MRCEPCEASVLLLPLAGGGGEGGGGGVLVWRGEGPGYQCCDDLCVVWRVLSDGESWEGGSGVSGGSAGRLHQAPAARPVLS